MVEDNSGEEDELALVFLHSSNQAGQKKTETTNHRQRFYCLKPEDGWVLEGKLTKIPTQTFWRFHCIQHSVRGSPIH